MSTAGGRPRILETGRLVLRLLEPDDFDALFALYSDPEIRRYFPEGVLTREETREELDWFRNGHPQRPELGLWATVHKETGGFIGRCGLLPWTIDGQTEVEVAYLLEKACWRRGPATEAAGAIRDHAFRELRLTRLVSLIDPENRASIPWLRSAWPSNAPVRTTRARSSCIRSPGRRRGSDAVPVGCTLTRAQSGFTRRTGGPHDSILRKDDVLCENRGVPGPRMRMRVVINGVGIAGPTLAWWLRRSGHEVTLVEEAPRLREGGYVIDFWGLGYDIAEKMGLIGRIRELGYQVEEVRFVNRGGGRSGGFSTDVFRRTTGGRFTSVRRSDLAATIYEALNGEVETLFGDSVAGIEDRGPSLMVTFDHAAPRECDLVIGADGLHSRVRRIVFGAESEFEVPLGYHVAAFDAEGYRPRDELVYLSHGAPGRQISRFSMRGDRTLFLFVFRDEYLPAAPMSSDAERKAVLARVFAGVGWECPRILEAMAEVDGVYFDRVSQIRMDRWTKGRTALIGDAAACVSLLAGEGTGLAMAEAYVLAGELHACGGGLEAAFARYAERMMPFLRRKQESAAKFASSFAPATTTGLVVRDLVTRLLGIPFVADWFIGRDLRDDITLPDYGWPGVPPGSGP